MRPLSSNDTFPGSTPSNEVAWNGPEIPCLGICTGQSLNKITYVIATKLCELAAPYDLSTLTLQGALDIFNRDEPANRTIANVFQLCLDNEVGLKFLIDGLQSQIDGISSTNFVANLKCLSATDAFGNAQSYTRDSVIQGLINELCQLESEFDILSGRVTNVENQINTLLNAPKVIEEVSVTTCISTNKPVSQSVVLLSGDYCNYKDIVGQPTSIQSAMAMQPADLTKALSSVSGWITMPAALAHSLGNAWLAIDNIYVRLSAMENGCCKASCDDVKVGYEIIPSDDGKFVSLKFSSASGTYIPAGVTDKGSELVITDGSGNTLSYTTPIEQGTTTEPLSLTGLDTSGALILELSAKLGSDSLGTCTKCLPAKSISATSACPVCQITSGISKLNFGSATIIYQSGGSYQTAVISSGGSVYIPTGAKVVAIDNPNQIVLSSDCVDLDQIEQFQCYVIMSSRVDTSNNGNTDPWEADNIFYKGLYVNGTRYLFPSEVGWNNTEPDLFKAINNLPNVGMLFKSFMQITYTDGSYGTKMYILFKTIPSIAESLMLISKTVQHVEGTAALEYLLPAYDRDTFISMGNASVPECPAPTSSLT